MGKPSTLLIAYHFPPESSGGTGRPESLFKYLPESDQRVVVLTRAHPKAVDDGQNVIRCDSLANWRSAPFRLSKIFWRIATEFLRKTFFDNSYDPVWYRDVKRCLPLILRDNNISRVYVTYPPVQSLSLGIYIKRKYQLPLIVEFRDGLVFEPLRKLNWLQSMSLKSLERKIVSCAEVVVTIGENLSAYFRDVLKARDVRTVYNGYDISDFVGISEKLMEEPEGRPLRFVHFGSIGKSKKRSMRVLCEALSDLKQGGTEGIGRFEVIFVGNFAPDEYALLQEYHLSDVARILRPLPKREGLALISGIADFLLFFGVKGETTFISSKIFDYFCLGKPILGICRGNEAGDLILGVGAGEVCGFSKMEIVSLFKRFLGKDIKFSPDYHKIREFDRRFQAAQIADILANLRGTYTPEHSGEGS